MSSLASYREKRDFSQTPEPKHDNTEHNREGPLFVIHKHDATTLHYDLRIEIDGVLKSWAIPKGPSTDPSEKRLAIATEDHPLSYAEFEGVIPEGQYGAGAVIVWDIGTYTHITEQSDECVTIEEAYHAGEISIILHGHKLRGGYALIQAFSDKKDQWLFIKMDDKKADARRNPTQSEPASVLSGNTIEEVKTESRE